MSQENPADPLGPFLDVQRGRARFTVEIPDPPELDHADALTVGVSTVDITPPPGMPKAGYSSNANDGSGFRTRLSARVFHLRGGRSSLAIVACDLLGGSSILQHLVADRIRTRTDVPLCGLFVGATHTHAGPGQFLGTDFYNRFASNRGGFDPVFADWLVERIAGAVIDAVETREPGRVAVGTCEVFGLTRNRSHGPHVRNESVADKRTEPQRPYVDINPELHLLRLDRLDGTPMGALGIFSVHGTGVSMRATTYNADVWAYLCSELDHRIEEGHGTRAVVGAIEGTHADVAPALRPTRAGHVEAERVGRGIGARAAELFDSLDGAGSASVDLAAGFVEVDLERSRSIGDVTLPSRPAVGAALVAGAHENTTPVVWRIPPFRAGMPKPWSSSDPHGAKWILGGRWIQPMILPAAGFPRILPIQTLRVGDTMIVGLPFEVTVEAGRRVVRAVEPAVAGSGVERIIVSSVANEYSGYAATAEEYARQHYEGGHTLYGPRTASFLAAHARRLAAATVTGTTVSDVSSPRRWDLAIRRYFAIPTGTRVRPVSRRTPHFVDATSSDEPYWEFGFRADAPGDLSWSEVSVAIERRVDGGAWEPQLDRGRQIDDRGTHVELFHEGSDEVGHLYATRWHRPVHGAAVQHRFVVNLRPDLEPLFSSPFD